ncbi:MAG: hypothetical protein QM586_04660, partial [Xenophilus sp.]
AGAGAAASDGRSGAGIVESTPGSADKIDGFRIPRAAVCAGSGPLLPGRPAAAAHFPPSSGPPAPP